MRQPVLSICIPNYNRADFLAKNLAAIGLQANQQVEIVVSDNASSEDILGVVKNFVTRYPGARIKLHRNRTNVGFDRNVIKVVSLARGKYCWLLSNDDKILPGSLKRILDLIVARKPALLVVNYRRFDQRLQRLTAARMINLKKDRFFTDANRFYFHPTPGSYFQTLGINTLTMSVDVFRRRFWQQSISRTKRFIGHNFIHVFTLMDVIKNHPAIYFLAEPQVQYVSNNHRFWSNLIWRDYRYILLQFVAKIGYDQVRLRDLKDRLKQDEVNERLWTAGERSGLYSRFFPYIRKIRQVLGHHV